MDAVVEMVERTIGAALIAQYTLGQNTTQNMVVFLPFLSKITRLHGRESLEVETKLI